MKTISTILALALVSIGLSAQFETQTFEAEESDIPWIQFANDLDDPDNLVRVENPDKEGVNTSDYCLKFIVVPEASPWVGAWTELGDLNYTEEQHMMYMMVYKDVITDCALKAEMSDNPATYTEVKQANSVTGEWEALEFDFTAAIGVTYDRMVFFPDFPATRTEGSTCYIDNIGFEDMSPVSIKRVNAGFMSIYPNPTSDLIWVQYRGMKSISISNITGQEVMALDSESNYIERVSISDLKPGVYFVTLDTEDGLVSSKFIKK